MKVYVDFKCLDAEDLPSNISNKYALQVKSINSCAEYKYFDLVDLADYTKQAQSNIFNKIKSEYAKRLSAFMGTKMSVSTAISKLDEVLGQIQGETK